MLMQPKTAKEKRATAAAPSPEVRSQVRDLLLRSEAFRDMPRDQQMEIANNTVRIVDYLARPDGISGNTLPAAASPMSRRDPYDFAQADDGPSDQDVKEIGKDAKNFKAQAALQGAKVAGVLLKQVNFPDFVSQLIGGVFHSIVQSSMDQMEAYAKLVKSIAQTLNDFRDENTTDNQGIDHLTEQFPDVFKMDVDTDDDGKQRPVCRMRDDADEQAALKKINQMPIEGGPVSSLDDDTIQGKLVPAARTQLATSRQQLLGTMVLMGINRIIVTDGRISAKIMYDFQARDTMKLQRSAVAYDYAKDSNQNPVLTTAIEGTYDDRTEGGESSYSHSKDSTERDQSDPSYYTKGTYKLSQQPIITASSAASETTDAALQTKAQLAGQVDVNFKSETFPLEKMADSFQIGMIQNAARPGQANAAAGAGGKSQASSGTGVAAPGNTAAAQPAPSPAR